MYLGKQKLSTSPWTLRPYIDILTVNIVKSRTMKKLKEFLRTFKGCVECVEYVNIGARMLDTRVDMAKYVEGMGVERLGQVEMCFRVTLKR